MSFFMAYILASLRNETSRVGIDVIMLLYSLMYSYVFKFLVRETSRALFSKIRIFISY